jgi:hypothetical protein
MTLWSRAQRTAREPKRTSVEIEARLAAVLAGGEDLLIVDPALSLESRVDDACRCEEAREEDRPRKGKAARVSSESRRKTKDRTTHSIFPSCCLLNPYAADSTTTPRTRADPPPR